MEIHHMAFHRLNVKRLFQMIVKDHGLMAIMGFNMARYNIVSRYKKHGSV